MNFTGKFNGPNPPVQTQTILFNDCDTGAATSDAPTQLNISTSNPWLTAAQSSASVIAVSVNTAGLAVGTYNGSVNLTIPDVETCEVGRVFSIPVTLTVQKGKVKFR